MQIHTQHFNWIFYKMNDSKRKSTSEFTAKLHHRSNAYQRKSEIIKGKNIC